MTLVLDGGHMITATMTCAGCGAKWENVQIQREDLSRSDAPWFCSNECMKRGEKPVTEKQKALNGVNSAMRLFMSAETKPSADLRYLALQYAIDEYYKTVWESAGVCNA